ncbi:MAG: hypothetical protein ACPGO3_01470 [Magnetospiraceae bacterium]
MVRLGPRSTSGVVFARLGVALAVGLALLIVGIPPLVRGVAAVATGQKAKAQVVREGGALYYRHERGDGADTRYYFIPAGGIERPWDHKPGDAVTVYVDSADPTQGMQGDAVSLIAGPALMVFLGLAGVYFGVTGLVQRRRELRRS